MLGFSRRRKYKIDYNGRKSAFYGARDEYRAGSEVKLYFRFIATDTDYSFFLDGQPINPSYDDKKGFEISFVMPEHDVRLTYSARNTMEYIPE